MYHFLPLGDSNKLHTDELGDRFFKIKFALLNLSFLKNIQVRAPRRIFIPIKAFHVLPHYNTDLLITITQDFINRPNKSH